MPLDHLTPQQQTFLNNYIATHRLSVNTTRLAKNFDRRKGKVEAELGVLPAHRAAPLRARLASADAAADGGDFQRAYTYLKDVKADAREQARGFKLDKEVAALAQEVDDFVTVGRATAATFVTFVQWRATAPHFHGPRPRLAEVLAFLKTAPSDLADLNTRITNTLQVCPDDSAERQQLAAARTTLQNALGNALAPLRTGNQFRTAAQVRQLVPQGAPEPLPLPPDIPDPLAGDTDQKKAWLEERIVRASLRLGPLMNHPATKNDTQASAQGCRTAHTAIMGGDLDGAETDIDAVENNLDTLEARIASELKDTATALTALQALPVRPLAAPAGALPNTYVRPTLGGKASGNALSRAVAGMEWGGRNERRTVSAEAETEIARLRDLGVAAEVTVPTAGGKALKGNFFSGKGHNLKADGNAPNTNAPVVLFLSGSDGSAETYGTDLAKFYTDQGVSVLAANYRGYGGSDDETPSERTLLEDGQAMLEHLLKLGYAPEQIVVHGYSLGGAVGAWLEEANYDANRNGGNQNFRFLGAVSDRPMTSSYDAARSDIGLGPVGVLAGKIARSTAGALDAKEALANVPADVPRVVTTDTEDLGPAGDKMRQALQGQTNAQVTGQAGGGHLDHQAMLDNNRGALSALLGNRGFQPGTAADDHYVLDKEKGLKQFETQLTAIHEAATFAHARATTAPNLPLAKIRDWTAETDAHLVALKALQESGLLTTDYAREKGWPARARFSQLKLKELRAALAQRRAALAPSGGGGDD